jgi:type I restriction enzyme S subunit
VELPAGWAWATLEALLATEQRAITDGPFGSNLKSAHYTNEGAQVLRLQNVGDGTFRNARAYISLEHFDTLRKHEVKSGDLIIASLGEILPRVTVVPDLNSPAIVKADVIRARIHETVSTKWIMYALMSPYIRNYTTSRITGVGRPRLGLGEIRKLPVPVPPLAEQHRIVETLEARLSRLDVAKRELETARKKVAIFRKSALLSFVPESSPSSWEMSTVEKAGTLELGRQRHPNWHHGPEMRPYLRVANVFEDRIDTSDVMEMDFSGIFERFRLHPGDILLNEGQSPHLVGRPAMYRGEPPNVAFTNSLLRFKARPDVLPEWALMVFRRHLHARRFLREVRITTNIAHLSSKRLKTVEFPIPPIEEQKRLVQACDELMSYADAMDSALNRNALRAVHLRSAVLNHAFTGKLVPQDPSDEPASVLLDRIRAEREAQGAKPKRAPRARRAPATSQPPPPAAGNPVPVDAVQLEF